ncbi:MAG: L-tyrosine/L-tryptophan isonitrile synthase family protein [bacterium]
MNIQKKYRFIFLLSMALGANCWCMKEQAYTEESGYPVQAMKHYKKTLPQINVPQNESSHEEIATEIAELLCKLTAQENISGKDVLIDNIKQFVRQDRRIKLVLTSFPLKSSNTTTKTLTETFDFADYIGLYTLNHICKQIKRIYDPGARIHIYSREVQTDYANKVTQKYFNIDIFPEEARRKYQRRLKLIIKHCFSQHLELETVDEEIAIQNYEQVAKAYSLARQGQGLKDYLDRKIFWEEDLCWLRETNPKTYSKSKIEKCAKDIAKCMIIGSEAMKQTVNQLLEEKMYIKLSMHPDNEVNNHIGFSLVYGAIGAPWHNVVAFDDDQLVYGHRDDIEKHVQQKCKLSDMQAKKATSCLVRKWNPPSCEFELEYVDVTND